MSVKNRNSSLPESNEGLPVAILSIGVHVFYPQIMEHQSSRNLSSTNGSVVINGLEKGLERHDLTSTTSGADVASPAKHVTSRVERPPFTHSLSHSRTGPQVLVDFEGPDDPFNPMNWTFKKKTSTTVLYGLTTLTSTWASAA